MSEVSFNSEPDIMFTLLDRNWLLGVKIGETPAIYKSAFIQYQRHREESRRNYGLLLFLPENIRRTKASQDALLEAVAKEPVVCLIDTPGFKEEYQGLTFHQVLAQLVHDIGPKLDRVQQPYPLGRVISLLQQHVNDLMGTIALSDPVMLRVITDKKLLSEIGHLGAEDSESAARFLAAYIFLSQVLFLRMFGTAQPDKLPDNLRPATHHSLRTAFNRILEINYRPIFEIDVLDALSEDYLRDTFDLIWGLEVEQVRYELAGRIFHELMPPGIRKMLAAFYTRPQAADLLAQLTLHRSDNTVLDPACGSGTILVAAYRRKLSLFSDEGKSGNPHKRFCEEEIFGDDIMPFGVHLATANLAAMDPSTTIEHTQIIQGDSLSLFEGRAYRHGVQASLFPTAREAQTLSGERYEVALHKVDTVLMNPPFTKVERGIQQYVDMRRFAALTGGEVGLWGHFIALADEFLSDDAIFGGVIPISILRGRESAKVREIVFSRWTPLYILKATFNYGFSEWSEYRDVL
ncbi:MAG: class I SAM-dependent DNA methyltransferase, partial [Candidatus Bathyarchaeia archaeon]